MRKAPELSMCRGDGDRLIKRPGAVALSRREKLQDEQRTDGCKAASQCPEFKYCKPRGKSAVSLLSDLASLR